MADASVVIHWFRHDLRLADNPALTEAAGAGAVVIPVFVLDDDAAAYERPGSASRWWLHGSLSSLDENLRDKGSRLILRRGSPVDALMKLAAETNATAIHLTRGYEPRQRQLEQDLRNAARPAGIEVRRFASAALIEPEAIATQGGDAYRVFTPFWRSILDRPEPATPLPAPDALKHPTRWPASESLASWDLLPTKPDWAGGFRETWKPGEVAAHNRLTTFLEGAVTDYATDRDRPDRLGTSRLSPHLHFGEISPRQIWHTARKQATRRAPAKDGADAFLRELGWREFCLHLLFHWPETVDQPFRPEFASFPWLQKPRGVEANLQAWHTGQTGYPIVDAGMRELWHTGWMHNRVRMIAASFLTKHLLIPWQTGASWFLDTLVDADLANNQAGWQWVAGSGADAAPYFRVFNPVLQGGKFDPHGNYIRRWIPEIAELATKHIHAPWLAPPNELAAAGITLGKTYPPPIVDHAEARARALAAYGEITGKTPADRKSKPRAK